MPQIIRLDDTSSHGGKVTSAASKSFAEGKKIARKGDTFDCPIDGTVTITEGSDKYLCEGAKVARHGDKLSCGATLIASATKTPID